MNRRYVKGRAFEYKIKKEYEKRGFFVVRSAGSHSPVDLIAIKGHYWNGPLPNPEVLLIQCKAVKKIPKNDPEWSELFTLAHQTGATAVVRILTQTMGEGSFKLPR